MRLKGSAFAGPFFIDRIDMFATCAHVSHMSKMVQIRNVPDALHRRLKARSAMAGMSLSDYLLAEIRRLADRPTLEEMRARIEARTPLDVRESAAEIIRAERDRR